MGHRPQSKFHEKYILFLINIYKNKIQIILNINIKNIYYLYLTKEDIYKYKYFAIIYISIYINIYVLKMICFGQFR